jgi:hypothetical protein
MADELDHIGVARAEVPQLILGRDNRLVAHDDAIRMGWDDHR